MNGLKPLKIWIGSYDVLIGINWIDKHHAILDCHTKTCTCLDDEGNIVTIKGIPRPVSLRQVTYLQLHKFFRKGCHIYAACIN